MEESLKTLKNIQNKLAKEVVRQKYGDLPENTLEAFAQAEIKSVENEPDDEDDLDDSDLDSDIEEDSEIDEDDFEDDEDDDDFFDSDLDDDDDDASPVETR